MRKRRGMTLAELLVASTVLVLIGGAMVTLASAVYSAHEVCRNRAAAAQHARVALDRIERSVALAKTSENFPGFVVVDWPAGGYLFPDCLAVWRPAGAPVDPLGLPRVNELVVFAPDVAEPNRLLEMTWPSNTSAVPSASDVLQWRLLIDGFHASNETVKNQVTDRLHVGSVDLTELLNEGVATRRAKLRFLQLISPSAAEWSQYRLGLLSWNDLDWPLDLYGSQTGVRTVALQVEIQVRSGPTSQPDPIPFFGSAGLNYTLNK